MRSKCFLLATRENGSNQVENLSEQSRDSNKPNLYMVPRPESNPGHIGSRQVVSSRQQHCVNLKQHKSQDTAQVAGCVCVGGGGEGLLQWLNVRHPSTSLTPVAGACCLPRGLIWDDLVWSFLAAWIQWISVDSSSYPFLSFPTLSL